jgi:hypothetical protein
MTWFTDHFNTQLVTTLNYNAIANLHTLQITTTYRLVFSVCYTVPTSRFLVTASNSGDFSASEVMPLPAGHHFTTELSSKLCPVYNPSAQTNRKHSSSVVACVSLGFLCDRHSASPLVCWLLPSNSCHLVCFMVFA